MMGDTLEDLAKGAVETMKAMIIEGDKIEGHSELGRCWVFENSEFSIPLTREFLWGYDRREIIPLNHVLQSLCFNDMCCNPHHLELITVDEWGRRHKTIETHPGEARALENQLTKGFHDFMETEGDSFITDDDEGYAQPRIPRKASPVDMKVV